jgi:glycerol-3-phosphate dehydrogenase
MADVTLPMTVEAAVLVAVRGRHCNMVLNRLGDAGPGDLLVPQRNQTVLAGGFAPVDDPEPVAAADGTAAVLERAAEVLPAVGEAAIRASWSSVRPVFHDRVRPRRGATPVGRETVCVDHAAGARPVDGLVTIAGGNAGSLRLMAERAGDLVCRKLGVDRACQTSEQPLLPDGAWYTR